MTLCEFFLPMKPPTKTFQDKVVRFYGHTPGIGYSYEAEQIKEKFKGMVYKYVPDEPFDGPLRIVLKWLFPLIEGSHDGQWKTTKPDVDNLPKMIVDAMTSVGFWKDDNVIASLICEKFWAEKTGIYIQIQKLEEQK